MVANHLPSRQHLIANVLLLFEDQLTVVNLDVVDSCPGWEPILSELTKAANVSLTSATVTFHHADIVTEYAKLREPLSTANLVTLMFTLNELITGQGKVAATKFLINLIQMIPKGSLILVISSNSYAYIDC